MSLLLVLTAITASGCSFTQECPKGQTIWTCAIAPTPCHMAYVKPGGFCASNDQDAIQQANADARAQLKLQDQNITGTVCQNTGRTTYSSLTPKADTPKFMTMGDPSCDAFGGDDACVSCAKTACCSQYQACASDVNCSCLVGCLYEGMSVDACTSTDNCGSPTSIAIATAACLNNVCSASCANVGSMGPSMCPSMGTGAGSGGSTGTGSSCTPGAFGAGESCFSAEDCSSCACNAQTMTCS